MYNENYNRLIFTCLEVISIIYMVLIKSHNKLLSIPYMHIKFQLRMRT